MDEAIERLDGAPPDMAYEAERREKCDLQAQAATPLGVPVFRTALH